MNSTAAREALSAMLDDEAPGSDPAAARTHAEECADCAHWYERAQQLGRRLRIAPVNEPGPDVTVAVLVQVELAQHGRWQRPLRVALIAAGVAQLAIGGPKAARDRNSGPLRHTSPDRAPRLPVKSRLSSDDHSSH